jgi:rRNA maturation endonuclease Nob1
LLTFNGQMAIGGIVMIFLGAIIGGVNKLIFGVRRTQLTIDTKEAIRDKMRNACPSCGAINPTGSQFCNTCGRRLAAEPPRIRESEVSPPPVYHQPRYQEAPPPTAKENVTIPCDNCGTLMPLTAHFCANCGAKRARALSSSSTNTRTA